MFHASGPAGVSFDGTTTDLELSEQGEDLHVVVPLANLDTGMSLRNRHMKEKYLEINSYPNAELVVPKRALSPPADGASSTGDIPGMLSLHGITKPVVVHATVRNTGGRFDVSGTLRINMNEYGIKVPSYLGVTVKPDVGVDCQFSVAGS